MKIIFSRKGFDSSSGGVPSPIFPDGKLLSLPIPDKNSPIAYKDIAWEDYNVGEIVESLTKGKIPPYYRAHLDPDINETSIRRSNEWRPLFGQIGPSQGHLRNQGVSPGDLFLFFGLFQEVLEDIGKLKRNPESSPKHILWGWFQIESSLRVDEIDRTQFEWAMYHPHFHGKRHKSNTIYLAKKTLDIPGLNGSTLAGAGTFSQFSDKLQLTTPNSSVSTWKLPLWMYPTDEVSPLSYHGKLDSWQKGDGYALLQTVGRGQEFVLDCSHYPESMAWLSNLLTR
ncbi:MAG: hypothetical protein KDJ97_23665 [Anaerolineae bacterium]|nr:hypothetical protein [Anaerolineae bacterium]